MSKNCKRCGNVFTSKTLFEKYCSDVCRSRDRFVIITKNDITYKVWEKNYQKYEDFYNDPVLCKKGKINKCFVCGETYEKYRMCCSKECTEKMKSDSLLSSVGAYHNLSRKSLSRKEMEERLFKKYGVNNVFAIDEVKKKLKESWGFENPSQNPEVKKKVRKTNIEKGVWLPIEKKDQWHYYKSLVKFVTNHSINKFAFNEWGYDFIEKWSIDKFHVDHVYSIYDGYLNKIDPLIVGSFCNLQFIWCKDNFSKGRKSGITLDNLLEKYESFYSENFNKMEYIKTKYEELKNQQQDSNENKIN